MSDDEESEVDADFLDMMHDFNTPQCERSRLPAQEDSSDVRIASIRNLFPEICTLNTCFYLYWSICRRPRG